MNVMMILCILEGILPSSDHKSLFNQKCIKLRKKIKDCILDCDLYSLEFVPVM